MELQDNELILETSCWESSRKRLFS